MKANLGDIFVWSYQLFSKETANFFNYIINEITFNVEPWYINYFWWLIALSLLVWGLEVIFPWRKNQNIIRKDFWLDTFYMFFYFYIFKLVVLIGFSVIAEKLIDQFSVTAKVFMIYDIQQLHPILQLIIFFLLIDFIGWVTHNILHRVNFLWKFHKLHHSVQEMGFAAHLRYHWMETLIYSPTKYIILLLIGNFEPEQAFIVYYISIAIGHLNHANINISYGPLKYLINNPKMHIWHHSKELPKNKQKGVNFGISLSVWDYMFKTAYIPHSGRDLKLGFEHVEKFPKSFFKQITYGFKKTDI